MAKDKMSFEDSVKRLDEIVKLLERGDAPLSESLKLFEEGTSLISYATENPHRCQFKSVNDSPRIVISSVGTVGEALAILKGILPH